MSLDVSEAWNSPRNVEAARANPQPLHLGDLYPHAPAISPEGSLIALTLPMSPVNEIAIVDSSARRGWILSHPNQRVKLAQPTFSPDGRSLAIVVTPPTYFGMSEIWIAPLRGGSCQVISQRPSACFVLPQFSPDGSRLVCFGDANQSLPLSQHRSYRTGGIQFALYEITLGDGEVVRVAQQAWSWVELVAYAPANDGFFLRTGLPAMRVLGTNGVVRWEAGHDPTGAHGRDQGRHGFFLRRGTEPVFPLASVIPEAARERAAALVGVADGGELLVRVSRPNQAFSSGFASVLVRCADGRCDDWIAPGDVHLQEAAISRHGAVAMGRVSRKRTGGAETVLPEQSQVYLSRDRDGVIGTLNLPDDISFDPEPRLLRPAGQSEIAS